jgi:PAS domain S-box-containing protein
MRGRAGIWRRVAPIKLSALLPQTEASPPPASGSGPSSPDGRLEHTVLANMTEGASIIRASDGLIAYTNPSWDRLFGYARGELVARHVSVVNAPADQTPLERAQDIMGALARDGSWTGTVHNVRKDGTTFWSEAGVVEAEHLEFGTVWVSVVRELTSPTPAEDALRASEERLRAAFELSAAPTLLLDESARIEDANGAFCELTGYSVDELLGKPLADVTHPEDAALDAEFVASVFRGAPRTVERRYVTKQGQTVPVTVNARVMSAADGQPLCAVVTVNR